MTEEVNKAIEKRAGLTLFYTTAEDNRPTYRRGILDALCYPQGHLLEYSYRIRNINPNLRKSGKDAAGASARGAIVFVDSEHGAWEKGPERKDFGRVIYFPLRYVKIVKAPPWKSSELDGGERVNYLLELEEFVDYDGSVNGSQWNEKLVAFDSLRAFRGGIPEYFVVPALDILTTSKNPRTGWENAVTAVSKSSRLSNAIFMRIGSLQEVGKNKEIVPQTISDQRVYELTPGRVYRLNFSLFQSATASRSKPEAIVSIRSSTSGLLQVDQSYQSAVSGISERSALVACKRTVEETLSVVSIEVGDTAQTIVNSPNPNLFVRPSLSKAIKVGFVMLIFAGGFLVSLDDKVVSELSLFFGDFVTKYPEFWVLFWKLVGAACLGWAGWLAFRKLPSKGGD
jgi:hypothetical protein